MNLAIKTALIGTLCAIALSGTIAAPQTPEQPDRLKNARDFLKLDLKGAEEFANKLSPEETRSLQSQILQLSKARNPDVEKLNYLLLHLASLNANALGQTRLNNLLLVIMLTVILFSAFLFFVFWNQRKVIQ